MRARSLAALLLALGSLGAGTEPQRAAVSIDNFAFGPAEISVAQGATVVWTNHDDIPHTVTASEAPRAFKSAVLDTDQGYSVRFDHTGRFAYFAPCTPHAGGRRGTMIRMPNAIERMPLANEVSEFERQVLPHLDAAYNLARWLVRDPATAEDVVQETMLRALRYHAGLRGAAKPWLLQIVRNVAYANLAAQRRMAEVPFADDGRIDPVDPAADPEAALAHSQDLHGLDRALAALPDALRECLVLRELEDLSYKEIAQVTGVAIGTVMSRLWRARQALLETTR